MMSLNEHKELAKCCSELTVKLMKTYKNFKTKKEKQNSYEVKALKQLSELRNQLDNIVLRDYPEVPDNIVCQIYYGRGNNAVTIA